MSDTVKTQAAQSSRTLQRRGKQMAITAQTKAEGLQEAAADAVASAAGRFGAMVPKVVPLLLISSSVAARQSDVFAATEAQPHSARGSLGLLHGSDIAGAWAEVF